VVDATDSHRAQEMDAVDEVLGQIGADGVPLRVVFNKCDLLTPEERFELAAAYPGALFVSAATGDGVDALLSELADAASAQDRAMRVLLPYSQGLLCKECHEKARVLAEEYGEDGVLLEVVAPVALQGRLERYLADGEGKGGETPDPNPR
jgi:GTP-binding protein HflX